MQMESLLRNRGPLRKAILTQKWEQGHTFLLLEWDFLLHTREQSAEIVQHRESEKQERIMNPKPGTGKGRQLIL